MIARLVWFILFLSVQWLLSNGNLENDFIEVDGILVRKSDYIKAQEERKRKKEETEYKIKIDKEEAVLYNESHEITKDLPNSCQTCRLMVTEIQRKLKKYGKVQLTTKQGIPIYYKEDFLIWHVFDELCDEMKQYNIDKKTPFRYRKGVRSYLRRKADGMVEHSQDTLWVWNLTEDELDDPTGEIKRLRNQCEVMLINYQDDIRDWFYNSQNNDPLKTLCAENIIEDENQECLWIEDKNLEKLIEEEKYVGWKTRHEEL